MVVGDMTSSQAYLAVERKTKGEVSARACAEAAKASRPDDGEKRMAVVMSFRS